MANKVEDDFLYPVPIAGGETGTGLKLTNALDAIYSLYQHAGAIPKVRVNPKELKEKEAAAAAADDGAKKGDTNNTKVERMDPAIKAGWFTYTDRVIPGGMMRLVETIRYPSPKGWQTTTAARVAQLFDRRFLVEFEDRQVIAQFTYTELDELRFAYAAIFDLVTGGQEAIAKTSVSAAALEAIGGAVASAASASSASASASAAATAAAAASASPSFYAAQTLQAANNSKVFENMWGLQGLARRDIKKNCEASSSSAAADGGASSSNNNNAAAAAVVVAGKQKAGVAKGGTGSSGLVRTDASKERPKLAAEKKHAKALLEDECVKLWPHTPPSKAAVFTLANDPNQPRHKPLYRATVELSMMNKRKIEGPWMGNKKDAEDGAAEVVLKFLYTSSFGKKK